MIQINGTIKMAAGTMSANKELVRELKALISASRSEDGCEAYTFAQDILEPDTLIICERWRDKKALAAHSASKHMAEFQKVIAKTPPINRDLRIYETDNGKSL